jgi:predicted dehydrogenase
MSPPATVDQAPLRVRVVTADPTAYARVLPRCPRLECVQIGHPSDAIQGSPSRQDHECLLIGADVDPEAVVMLLGRALQQKIPAYLADGAVLDFAPLAELQQAFAREGLWLQAGQPLRHRPLVESVRVALWQGQLGEPAILRIHDWRSAAGTRDIPPGWELRAIRQYTDLICWLLQAIPETVWATRPVVPPAKDPAPGFVETLQFHAGGPGPAMIVCDLAHGLPQGDEYWSLSLIGARGAAYADDHHNRQLLFGGGTARAVCTREGDWPLWQQLQALRVGAGDGADAAAASPAPGAAALTRAIELSLRTQRSVSVEPGGAR